MLAMNERSWLYASRRPDGTRVENVRGNLYPKARLSTVQFSALGLGSIRLAFHQLATSVTMRNRCGDAVLNLDRHARFLCADSLSIRPVCLPGYCLVLFVTARDSKTPLANLRGQLSADTARVLLTPVGGFCMDTLETL